MITKHLPAVFVLVAAAATAQAKPLDANLSTRLHGAWLREMLDLDVRGAVADYEDIANDRSGHWERWVAVTRLAELRRVGIPMSAQPLPVAEAPAEIRAALALLIPLPFDELLKQAAAETVIARPVNGTENPRLPDLWPATAQAQNWVRSQSSLSATERSRQRGRAASTRVRPDATRNDNNRIDWSNATDIVRRELEGKARQADALRDVWFADWHPPTVKEDGAIVLARVRANLDAWLEEPMSPNQQALLGRLRNEIEQRAAVDVATGLDLVKRLPKYSERLLGEPGKLERSQTERGQSERGR